MGTLKNRIDMIGYITVKNSNPNGDIDMNNMPRQDADGYGLMSDVCRKGERPEGFRAWKTYKGKIVQKVF